MLATHDIPRVIPCLLIENQRLVKTIRFRKPIYVGDPVNAARIFNDKEVDEVIILDIGAAKARTSPDFEYIRMMASECFMPMTYGGGVQCLKDAEKLFALGVEKVSINTAANCDPQLIREMSNRFGSQSVVASIDVKKNFFGGYSIRVFGGSRRVTAPILDHVQAIVSAGAGELLINSIDRDGTMSGYDEGLIEWIAGSVDVPVIACGGAGSLADFRFAVEGSVSAVAAGAFFVFSGPHRAVLITYPERAKLEEVFNGFDPERNEPA